MSHLQYYAYPGIGEERRDEIHYSQAVRVGDRIECSGQGGWDTKTGKLRENLKDEIDQAFANVDYNLKDAGGKGWSQVFRVNVYMVCDIAMAHDDLVRNLREWMPDHQPLLTVVGVRRLYETMQIEIEVSAHGPK